LDRQAVLHLGLVPALHLATWMRTIVLHVWTAFRATLTWTTLIAIVPLGAMLSTVPLLTMLPTVGPVIIPMILCQHLRAGT
jgi:hypothetical protein